MSIRREVIETISDERLSSKTKRKREEKKERGKERERASERKSQVNGNRKREKGDGKQLRDNYTHKYTTREAAI